MSEAQTGEAGQNFLPFRLVVPHVRHNVWVRGQTPIGMDCVAPSPFSHSDMEIGRGWPSVVERMMWKRSDGSDRTPGSVP